jgi:hypothetical protein
VNAWSTDRDGMGLGGGGAEGEMSKLVPTRPALARRDGCGRPVSEFLVQEIGRVDRESAYG